MSTLTVPTIPSYVADANERVRAEPNPFSNAKIVEVTLENGKFDGETPVALRSIPFDTLLAALVNGYEREKTVEEVAHDRIRTAVEVRLTHAKHTTTTEAVRHTSFVNGIKFALRELGVKIEGVNA